MSDVLADVGSELGEEDAALAGPDSIQHGYRVMKYMLS
jgi:hypothetical protein